MTGVCKRIDRISSISAVARNVFIFILMELDVTSLFSIVFPQYIVSFRCVFQNSFYIHARVIARLIFTKTKTILW